MSASALSVVMEDLGSLPLRVATATASVGASATPMSRAAPQMLTPTSSCRIPATPKAVTMTSRVPVRIMPRMRVRASRQEVLRASEEHDGQEDFEDDAAAGQYSELRAVRGRA